MNNLKFKNSAIQNKSQTTCKRKPLIPVSRKAALKVAVLGLLLFGSERASATILYATSSSNNVIY